MKKTILSNSGHTLFVNSIKFSELPQKVRGYNSIKGCEKYYTVQNWDSEGVIFMYIGLKDGQYMVWYKNGGFWYSFGTSIEKAINGAQADGWMYA